MGKPKCPDCGGEMFRDIYDGGNGEGARIVVKSWICWDCSTIVRG